MTSLYEVLKRSKTAPQLAPDMFTALWAKSITAGKTIELSGQVPLSFKANGEPLLDYLISGNTVQNGTPTPASPIQPSECGERTNNLARDVFINPLKSRYETIMYFDADLKPDTEYTISFNSNAGYPLYTNENIFTQAKSFVTVEGLNSVTVTTKSTLDKSNNSLYSNGRWRILKATQTLSESAQITNVMLNSGSSALPYEPFGYKIPISSASTTTPVYLGEVETERKIRKLVLTGGETHWYTSNGFMYIDTIQPDYLRSTAITLICSHYKAIGGVGEGAQVSNGRCALYRFPSVQRLYIRDNNYTSAADFKSYLAAQYAAGTPVTVWYVLAEPETAVVNEPLMKIGDYADTLSMEQAGVQIPTNKGSTTLDVLTAVKPSNVSIKYRV